MSNTGEAARGGRWLSPALLVAEVAAAIGLMLAYRSSGKSGGMEFLLSRPGLLCLGMGGVLLLALGLVVQQIRQGLAGKDRQWILALAMNAVLVMAVLVGGELVVRMLAVETNTEARIGGRLLYPRQWLLTADRFQRILTRAKSQQPFWVADPELGWTVGANRESADGLYRSTVQGIRAAQVGQTVGEAVQGCRVAFVGDSFTFGEEVRYEDAWVSLLEKRMEHRCQVLNFAVGGYGIDQMYLRYLRDVRPWKPTAVVLSFVNHDVVRSMSVYSFLMFPGGETPFAKPRFVVRHGELVQLNRPLVTPEQLFQFRAIKELPFIEHDANYKWTEWDQAGWGWLGHSYFLRLLVSAYPLHEPERQEIADERMEEVNAALFRRFLTAVEEDGASSRIVYLPSIDEVPERPSWVPVGTKILTDAKLPHVNIRDCMAAGFGEQMFMPPGHGQHYAPEGNRVAAKCLAPVVESLIERRLPLARGVQ